MTKKRSLQTGFMENQNNSWRFATEEEKAESRAQCGQVPPNDQNDYHLNGKSIADFADSKINDQATLLGNRWLCRGDGAFIFAPSGIGKSTMTVQMGIEFALGRASFGIFPSRRSRSLIIQAEDSEGDLIEMAKMMEQLKLSKADYERVRANTWIETVNHLSGEDFLNVLNEILLAWPADLVFINPYAPFLGQDVGDQQANINFLYRGLNRRLAQHQCGAIMPAHTPKPARGFKGEVDSLYAGAGSAVLTNWARAIITIRKTKTAGVFEFVAAKRGDRIGWGDGVFKLCFAHSIDGIFWRGVGDAGDKDPEELKPADILPVVPKLDPAPFEVLWMEAKKLFKIGERKMHAFLRVLVHENQVFEWLKPRKNARSAIEYCQSKPTEVSGNG